MSQNLVSVIFVFLYLDITVDKRQMLYQSCVATDNETFTKCNRPVLEILQDKPYCVKHAASIKVEVNYNSCIIITANICF